MKYNTYVSKLIRFGLGFVAVVIITVGCQNNTSTGNNDTESYYTYTDDYNRTVKVPNNPKRIVSISPAITE
ncbi:MAG: ABC transporter substrate-binding protein, partial [Bacteroidales bacterium]|nr:ABC transporter substrate-binding protein [Bacteroidales bacterium]